MPWTIEVPAGVRFTCSRCGDCCHDAAILLGPGEKERLAGLRWEGIATDLVGATTTALTKDPAFRGRSRLLSRPGGACLYLGQQQQCRIHEHFGEKAKPIICQLYPFGFRSIGDRISVDVAFSCRAVSQGSGAPVSDHVDEWARELAERGVKPGPMPRLSARFPLSPEILWEMELHLGGLLATRDLSVADRVRCALDYLRLATTGDPATPAAAAMRAAIVKALPARIQREPHATGMDDTQRAVLRQWIFLSLNPLLPGFADLPAREQAAIVAKREEAAATFLEGRDHPWIRGAPLLASFDEVAAIQPGPLATGPEWIATFLSAKIVGQRFLSGGGSDLGLIEAGSLLFLCHPMIAWTAKALAASRGARVVSEADVQGAIRLVDRTFGQLGTSLLPRKQAKAFKWVMQETDLVACATHELIG